jgi:sugar-specific transcriptional regulator TrmB
MYHFGGIKLDNSEDCVSILCELGLSISQAKVILSLVKHKNLKAQEISSISGVARPYVYGVLVQLEEAGLVEKTISKPEEFHAIPIEKCIHNLIQKRVVKTAELQQKALTLSQYLKRETENEEISKEFHFIFIPNRESVYGKAEKIVRNAQKSMLNLF